MKTKKATGVLGRMLAKDNPQYAYSENVPNAETRSAIEECESGKELETLDITNFEDYVKSL
jgi:hypothetical protein